MACYLFCAKPLPESMMTYCQLDPWKKLWWNSNQIRKKNFQENLFENFEIFNHFGQASVF